MKNYVIYKATNTVNNKVYIGFDSSWPRRKAQHKHTALNGAETSNVFYNAIRKYGWDKFVWEVIYESSDGEHTLSVMENQFITEHNSYVYADNSNGYNMTLGGEGTLGHQKTPEQIEAHRKKLKGRKHDPEVVRRRTETRLANPNNIPWQAGKTKETDSRIAAMAKNISAALRGKPKSEEHKANIRLRPQDTTILTCPHCSKVGDYKNMKRWHMDNCKANPNKTTTTPKQVTCTVCGTTANESPNFYKHHNERCKG